MADRFLIAPFSTGLDKSLPVFMTPEDSFRTLENAYISNGVIKKRPGSQYVGTGATTELTAQLKSRLRILVDTADGAGAASGTIGYGTGAIGQMFSIGDDIFTVSIANGAMLSSTGGTHTFNIATRAYAFTGATALAPVYWYPSHPVMGLYKWEKGDIHDRTAIAFDTEFAYKFTGSAWARSGAQVYTGDNTNYFWATNFEGANPEDTAMFATNYYPNGDNSDPMYYTEDVTTWSEFTPIVDTGTGAGLAGEKIILTAKILAPFKSRLLAFGIYERTLVSIGPGPGFVHTYTYKTFKGKIAYCKAGEPLTVATSWLPGTKTGYTGGGFIDAPTEEEIVSIGYVQDRLIVYFERSTYELVYTFNDAIPFIFQLISADLGASSRFSSVQSKDGVLAMNSTGLHICNGVSVSRVDNKIPNKLRTYLKDATSIKRICSIKDFKEEVYYWAIPDQQADDTDKYPDKILVYNYENGSFAEFDDCITAFGYMEQKVIDTWEEDYGTWESDNSTWDSAEEIPGNRKVIAGNQHGYIFAITDSDNTNAPVLQVTGIAGTTITVLTHNLKVDDYIELHNSGVAAQDIIYRIESVPDDDSFTVLGLAVPAYTGAATISRVSKINIVSTSWNPYNTKGKNVYLSKIVFGVKRTSLGEISVNYFPSGAELDFITGGIATGAAMGTNVLETSPYDLIPLEASQNLLWHSVYFQAEGNGVQIQLTWNDTQIRDKNIVSSNFEIQGLILETSPTSFMG